MGQITGAGLIVAERQRQITEEGWSASHDDEHKFGELAVVAAIYATFGTNTIVVSSREYSRTEEAWPDSWDREWDKRAKDTTPGDIIRCLTKAGALIAAEIDRQLRLVDEEAYREFHDLVVESCVRLFGERHRRFFAVECSYEDEFKAGKDPDEIAQEQKDALT